MAGHFLIVEARFYDKIAGAQAAGAIAALEVVGASYERVSVPGALEIPAAIAMASIGLSVLRCGAYELRTVILIIQSAPDDQATIPRQAGPQFPHQYRQHHVQRQHKAHLNALHPNL